MCKIIDFLKGENKIAVRIWHLCLVALGLAILAIPWGLEPIMFDDSPAYLANQLPIGVVPGYPLFLSINRKIFGETQYLYYVVAEQIFINVVASFLLVDFLRKRFHLNLIEETMFYILSFVPHAVFMPEGMSSRMIVTEALAFPLFYVLFICALKTIWDKKLRWEIATLVTAVLLSLIRTQLQLTLIIPIFTNIYIFVKPEFKKKYPLFLRAVIGVGGGIILFVCGLYGNRIFNRQLQYVMGNLTRTEIVSDEKEVAENVNTEVTNVNISSQLAGVFYSKVMFTAEPDDQELFEDKQFREFFVTLYSDLLSDNRLLNSMEMDLFIADKIFNRIDGVYSESFKILEQYDVEVLGQYGYSGNILAQIAKALLQKHPLRWLKSGFLQIPSGLISSVFFHKRGIYCFSYLVTFLIYAGALGSVFLAIRKKLLTPAVEFMVCAIGVNLLFVFISAVVYIALQRYVIYGFGIFYMAFYIILKQMVLYRKQE